MCRECVEHAKRIFPEMDEAGRAHLLWNETSFPFGKPDEIEHQLMEVRRIWEHQEPRDGTGGD